PLAAGGVRAQPSDAGCPFSPPEPETPKPDPAPRWRLEIDAGLCQGHAACMGEAAELFFVGEANDATGEVKVAHPTDEQIPAARQAAKLCPNQAIRLIDNTQKLQPRGSQ